MLLTLLRTTPGIKATDEEIAIQEVASVEEEDLKLFWEKSVWCNVKPLSYVN